MRDSTALTSWWKLALPAVVVFNVGLPLRADTAPEITEHPVSQTVFAGDTVTFNVTATGGNLGYQWRHGATNIPGATANPLVLNHVTFDQAGNYSVLVSNSVSTAVSAKASLTVVSPAVWGWGANDYGKATPPAGMSNVVTVAAGGHTSLALKADGTVTVWGLERLGGGYPLYADVRDSLVNVVSVAGGFFGVALFANGTCIGWDLSEGCGCGPGGTNLVAIASGPCYGMCLQADGRARSYDCSSFYGAWGPTIDPGLRNVVALAAGGDFCLTVRGDGTVLAWGNRTNVPAGLSNVVAVACGGAHSLALRADGTVVAWGDNSVGQTNVPAGLSDVASIACGSAHCLALRVDGRVIAWGKDTSGETNVPPYAFPVGAIGSGSAANHSLAVPAAGPPFITTRLADQVWTEAPLPAQVFFRVEASGARPLRYQWQRNGVALPGETHAVLKVTDLLHHQGRYSVVVSNALGVATNPPARLAVAIPQTPLQAALDNYLPWTQGGSVAWFVQSTQTVDRVDAARSGAVAHNQESWLETSVVGPGFLVYWWKVSSEADFDFLEFHLDGALQPGRISGSPVWQQRIVPLASGPHTLRWRYVKDPADGAGWDAGFLDQVTSSTTLPPVAMLPNGEFQLCFTNASGTAHSVVGTTNVTAPLNDWLLLGNPVEISPGQYVFTDPLAPHHSQRYYRVRSP